MANPREMLLRARAWVDERTGFDRALEIALDEPIPGGASWAYVFGSATLILFLLQATTGALLAFYYVPTADHAHASVEFIQKAVPFGWLLRGLHFWGASAMVVLTVAHVAQVFVWGAYKGRREIVWLIGAVLLQLVLAFAFTGYLLPWDQKAYFGTQVGAGIAGGVPFVGELAGQAMLGGTSITTITLSRFFAAHVLWLPAITFTLIGAHVVMFRMASPAGSFRAGRSRERVEPFYPRQLFFDAVAALGLFAALVALSYLQPAPLEAAADPTSEYLPRPEWYFLSVFQLLKYFPASLAVVPAVILPGLIFGVLTLVPFLDRRAERAPHRRPVAVGAFVVVVGAIVLLTALARWEDRRDPNVRATLERQQRRAEEAMRAPFVPQQLGDGPAPAGGQTSAAPDPPPAAFTANCAACHGEHAEGGKVGPSLVGITAKPGRTESDLVALLEDPQAAGLGPVMPRFNTLGEAERREIAAWLARLPADASPPHP